MDSFKILIATGVLVFLSSFLIGCSQPNPEDSENVSPALLEELKNAASFKRDVALTLAAEEKDSKVEVKVSLKNPSRHPLTSVQSWLTYDPLTLKGVSIDVSSTPFSLTAPYENAFDEVRGLVRIGRGSEKPVTDLQIQVARVTFQRLRPGVTMVNVYDFKPNLRGHASANVLLRSKPFNVLLKPEDPALILQ